MDYYKYIFSTGVSNNDVLLALFSVLPFDTFVENEKGFDGYLPVDDHDKTIDTHLEDLQKKHKFTFDSELIKGENWNEAWEANFHPIQVNDFCGIRAEFHPPIPDVEHELIITPRMAFGTGHHETTFMVIQLMKGLSFEGTTVFDFGCGTGVLAILASKLGASSIDALDIEEASWQNTIENCETNGVKNVNAYKGVLGSMPKRSYGIVLANINRNVILDSLHSLSHMLLPDGLLIISGILKTDEELVSKALTKNGFETVTVIQKNNWIAMQCRLV